MANLSIACQHVEKMTEKGSHLATRENLMAFCNESCAAHLKLTKWEVCGLADGRIDGPGHGGRIGTYGAGSFGCWIVCNGTIFC